MTGKDSCSRGFFNNNKWKKKITGQLSNRLTHIVHPEKRSNGVSK